MFSNQGSLTSYRARRLALLVFATFALAAPAVRAATYLPISDAELARRSPLIVRARVAGQAVRIERIDGKDLPFTMTTFQVTEAVKGSVVSETVVVRLPGGRVGNAAWWIPGTPTFRQNQEVLLLLRPAEDRPNEFHLSEWGLSRFDLVQDETGRPFAVRPLFEAEEDLDLSRHSLAVLQRAPASRATPLRDADSFLAALRASASGAETPDVVYAEPKGAVFDHSAFSLAPEWVNIGGREPGDCGGQACLFRWFWDSGQSPGAVVRVNGAQTNLSDGTNGLSHVQNAIDQWHGVPSTDVRLSGISGDGNVTVNLDAATSHDGGSAWSTPLGCGGGTIGLGSSNSSVAAGSFRGDGNYSALSGGTVSLRKVTCASGYSAATFRTAVMHEMGHILGLGHSDQAQSTHSTTASLDWANAVMSSAVPPSRPSVPQPDDIQAVQFYYGAGSGGGPCVPSSTSLCLNNGRFRVTAAWQSPTQSGQGAGMLLTSDTGYFSFFSPNNVEVVVKVLNGCAINAKYWVFAAGLTNVQVTLTLTDTQTGAIVVKSNSQGVAFQPVQDTTTFQTCP